jgi:hypothetical protein
MKILRRGEKNPSMFKERRTCQRIQTNIDARFFYGNLFYSGTVSNVSDTGMLINTKRFLPADSMFVIIIRLENELLKVIAKVKRHTSTADNSAGMGVVLLSPSRSYLDLVNKMKTA